MDTDTDTGTEILFDVGIEDLESEYERERAITTGVENDTDIP